MPPAASRRCSNSSATRSQGFRSGRFLATDIFDPARSADDRSYEPRTVHSAAPTDGAFATTAEMMRQMAKVRHLPS